MSGIKEFYRGDTKKYRIKVQKEGVGPISVDGGKLTMTLKQRQSTPDNEADASVIVNCVEVDPLNPTGIIDVVLSHDDTKNLSGDYFYDFQFVSVDGEVTTLLAGKVKVLVDTTQEI